MALQTSGAISLADIQAEFGGSNPIGINEYYGVGTVPSSGAISLADFYGQSAQDPAGNVTIFRASVSGSTQYVTGGSGSYTFTVPNGYTQVSICMIGGGGSGAATGGANTSAGGGYAGAIKSQIVTGLTGGQQISVTIGAGGARKYTVSGEVAGNAGTASSFNGITAAGGAGGQPTLTSSANYVGIGASGSNCYGTFSDGTKQTHNYLSFFANGYGGQRGFGNGGNGKAVQGDTGTVYGNNGVNGSGGGGCATMTNNAHYSGAGGDGVCKISWA